MKLSVTRHQCFCFLLAVSGLTILTACENTQTSPVYLEASQSSEANQQIPPFGPRAEVSNVLLGSFLASDKGINSIAFVPWIEKLCHSASQCQEAVVQNKINYTLFRDGNNIVVKGQLVSTSGNSATIVTEAPGFHGVYETQLYPGIPPLQPQTKHVDFTLDFAHDMVILDGLYGSFITARILSGHVSVGSYNGNKIVSN